MTFEEWFDEYADQHLSGSHALVLAVTRIAWHARDAEVEALQKRIKELENLVRWAPAMIVDSGKCATTTAWPKLAAEVLGE